MVSCYAPQAGRSQIEKEEFWRQVEGVILIKREHKKRIMNTKVIPGEECVHGHHLV